MFHAFSIFLRISLLLSAVVPFSTAFAQCSSRSMEVGPDSERFFDEVAKRKSAQLEREGGAPQMMAPDGGESLKLLHDITGDKRCDEQDLAALTKMLGQCWQQKVPGTTRAGIDASAAQMIADSNHDCCVTEKDAEELRVVCGLK